MHAFLSFLGLLNKPVQLSEDYIQEQLGNVELARVRIQWPCYNTEKWKKEYLIECIKAGATSEYINLSKEFDPLLVYCALNGCGYVYDGLAYIYGKPARLSLEDMKGLNRLEIIAKRYNVHEEFQKLNQEKKDIFAIACLHDGYTVTQINEKNFNSEYVHLQMYIDESTQTDKYKENMCSGWTDIFLSEEIVRARYYDLREKYYGPSNNNPIEIANFNDNTELSSAANTNIQDTDNNKDSFTMGSNEDVNGVPPEWYNCLF